MLSAIKILTTFKNDFSGTVWAIFQPAEEKLPGGAKQMIDKGLLKDIHPSVIIGQHTMPGMELGKIGVRSGNYMASTDEIYLTLKGKGGHAALPHEITDIVLMASELIIKMQQVVSRFVPAAIPTVLSFGKIVANGATNIMPAEVKIEGTLRMMNEEWRKKVHKKITEIIHSVVATYNADFDLEIRHGYPVLYNDPEATAIFKKQAIDFLGENNVLDLDIRMTAEDFAYFSHKVASVFYRIGTGNKRKNIISPLHSPTFDIDEEIFRFAPGLLANAALTFLKNT
ncbi:MAG TPA: amidohydrolase [Bacteroidales bacterium]|nr:amidohydrolase [Bacteroidales bacterium]